MDYVSITYMPIKISNKYLPTYINDFYKLYRKHLSRYSSDESFTLLWGMAQYRNLKTVGIVTNQLTNNARVLPCL